MVLKSAIAAALCTGLLMSGSAALADEYRAGEFLGLDLSKALLSPKRLGPETEFAPVRIEARTDRKPVKTERVVVPKVAERAVVPEIAERPKVAQRKTRDGAGPGGEAARCRPRQTGAAAQQSARCAGARYANPDLAVQVRRHLRLAEPTVAGLGWAPLQGVTYR